MAKDVTKRVQALHARREAAGQCINDPRDSGGDPHPKPNPGDRECPPCKEARSTYNRKYYKRRKRRGLL